MSMFPEARKPAGDQTVEVEGVPPEEDISEADVARRADESPAEQENRRDPVEHPEASTED